MATTAQTFYLGSTRATGLPAGTYDYVTTAETGTTTTQTTHTGTGATTVQIKPFVGNSTTSASITAAAGFGWRAKQAADVNSVSGAQRFIPAGVHSMTVLTSLVGGTTGVSVTITAVVHLVSASGTLTELFRFASASTQVTTLNAVAITATSAAQPQLTLGVGETFEVELWATTTGQAVTGAAQTVAYSTASGTFRTLPAPGLRTQYPGTVAESITATSDAITRKVIRNRSLTETAGTASDTVTRRFTGTRTVLEAVTTTSDAVTRSVILTRRITENIGSTGGGGTNTVTGLSLVFVDGRPAIHLGGPQYTAV